MSPARLLSFCFFVKGFFLTEAMEIVILSWYPIQKDRCIMLEKGEFSLT